MSFRQLWTPSSLTAGRGAALVAGIYLLTGCLWISLSDGMVAAIAEDAGQAVALQNLKGWGFVLVTGIGLFFLVYRGMRMAVRSTELENLVSYDAVTGLPNSGLLTSQMHRALALAAEQRGSLAVLVVHMGGLRRLNDSLGPAAGDLALATMADRLRRSLAPGDLLARHEGSSFVALLETGNDPGRADRLSRALLRTVAEPVLVGGTEFAPRASVGISRFPADADTPRELIAAAMAAMHRAREQGGWHVHRYTTRMARAAYERFRIESELRKAVETGTLNLVYQPQVCLADGRTVGLEALLRWTDAELGPVPPSRFIPIAEESGVILPIGEWVLLEACRQGMAWRRAGVTDLRIAVNLSARQFGQRRLLKYVQDVLAETGLPAQCLELEVTEHVTAREPEMTLRILQGLKEIGVTIAIDDFGIGYSSLSYLQLLPIDRLKIDRSFVLSITADSRGEAICRTILDMGRHLGLQTLAEGIENEAQRRALMGYGCGEGQGFLFARPLSAGQVPLLVQGDTHEAGWARSLAG